MCFGCLDVIVADADADDDDLDYELEDDDDEHQRPPAPPLDTEEDPEKPKPPPTTFPDSIPFKTICRLLEATAKRRSGRAKFLFDAKIDASKSKSFREVMQGYDWWPVMRLIVPDGDRERYNYRLKEKNLALVFIKALGWYAERTRSQNAKRLLHPTDASLAPKGGVSGSLPDVLVDILRERGLQSRKPPLTVKEINAFLDQLCEAGQVCLLGLFFLVPNKKRSNAA